MSVHLSTSRSSFLPPKPSYKSPQLGIHDRTPIRSASVSNYSTDKHVPAPLALSASAMWPSRNASDKIPSSSESVRRSSRSNSVGVRAGGPSLQVQPLPTLPASPAYQEFSKFEDSDDESLSGQAHPTSGTRSRLASLGYSAKLFRPKRTNSVSSAMTSSSTGSKGLANENSLRPLLLQPGSSRKPNSHIPVSPRTVDYTLQLELQGSRVRREPNSSAAMYNPHAPSKSQYHSASSPIMEAVDVEPKIVRKSRSSQALRYDPQRRPKQLPSPPALPEEPALLPPVPSRRGSVSSSEVPLDDRFGLPRQAPTPHRLPPQKPPPSFLPPPPPPPTLPTSTDSRDLPKTSVVKSTHPTRSFHALITSCPIPRSPTFSSGSVAVQLNVGGTCFTTLLATLRGARSDTPHLYRLITERMHSSASKLRRSGNRTRYRKAPTRGRSSETSLSRYLENAYSSDEFESTDEDDSTPVDEATRTPQACSSSSSIRTSSGFSIETPSSVNHLPLDTDKRIEDLCPRDVGDEDCETACDPVLLASPKSSRTSLVRGPRGGSLKWTPSKTWSKNRPGIRFTASSFLPPASQDPIATPISVFLDRDPTVYIWLLDGLRTGKLPIELTCPAPTADACSSDYCIMTHTACLQKTRLEKLRQEADWLGYTSIVTACDQALLAIG